ncbi:group 3 secretory phospholipase A2-like [Xiphias gladius]|uniref:group 3 secretory phospholipase A2-like n=1 Tax=Xiphias gladius TaxID=8245 RepID=UPI001A9957B9|nr:group 3 secretory phospholipase A2-like [Xiphias gladius]
MLPARSSPPVRQSLPGAQKEMGQRGKLGGDAPGYCQERCGAAVRYEQLGMFESADRCCREHDRRLCIIPAFTVNYGVFNPNFHTVSHCDCDHRFRQCLLDVNDTRSISVGYSFFNILRVPCFELKQQRRCTETYWWGMCKVTKEGPYAVFPSTLPYRTSDAPGKYGDNSDSNNLTSSEGQHVTESPLISPHNNQPLCGSLKHLDECKYQIRPLEKKYELQNMESKTAYHCDCTSRLAVQLKSFKQPRILPTLLMDFVSQYCFELLKEKTCNSRKSCSVEASLKPLTYFEHLRR